MLPFCGYHMADYFAHWLKIGERKGAKLPQIFYVNWFRKGDDGKFLWPGYGENSRVLAWIFRRCEGKAEAVETQIGLVPPVGEGGIDIDGLDVTAETMARAARGRRRGLERAAAADARALRVVRRQAPAGAARRSSTRSSSACAATRTPESRRAKAPAAA